MDSQHAVDRPGALKLAPHETVSFEAYRGLGIECVAGHLWITLEGDTRDRFLMPGVLFRCPVATRVVVNPLEGHGAFRLHDGRHLDVPREGGFCIRSHDLLDRAAKGARSVFVGAILAHAWRRRHG